MSSIDDRTPSIGEILSDPALLSEYPEFARSVERFGELLTKLRVPAEATKASLEQLALRKPQYCPMGVEGAASCP